MIVAIELRRSDALAEMRDLFRKGIEKIDAVSEDSFQSVAESVTNNF
jgi:hypothetical protein